jgi:hypothetical protein
MDLKEITERDARDALRILTLPILVPDSSGRYHCPTTTRKGAPCSKFLERNFSPRDVDGYASLNCTYHGWVGKWRRLM